MLAFVRALEGDLASLSQEARRAIPAVKEASEHALLELRKAHSAARTLSEHEWRELVSQSCIQPIYLACNHVDAPKPLLAIAMGSLQRAVKADALLSDEYYNVVRVLEIQAGSADEGMRLRVLQALPLVLSQVRAPWEARVLATPLLASPLEFRPCRRAARSKNRPARRPLVCALHSLPTSRLPRCAALLQRCCSRL
jgi:hypothetical protein